MYKQLTSEQRLQIFAFLQRKCPRKEIARIVGISQCTLSRELKRNSTRSGKCIWFKAHEKAVERRKRSGRNAALAPELVWRIKQLIIEEQWSPRQISGVLNKEGISVSHQSIYNPTHVYTTRESWRDTRVINSNIGAAPNTSIFPLPRERAFTHTTNGQTENVLGILDGLDYGFSQPHHTHDCWAFNKHALHDQTCPGQEVRTVDQSRQTSASTLQVTHQDHHHQQRLRICRTQAHYKVFGSRRLFRRSLCLMTKGSDKIQINSSGSICQSTPISMKYLNSVTFSFGSSHSSQCTSGL